MGILKEIGDEIEFLSFTSGIIGYVFTQLGEDWLDSTKEYKVKKYNFSLDHLDQGSSTLDVSHTYFNLIISWKWQADFNKSL